MELLEVFNEFNSEIIMTTIFIIMLFFYDSLHKKKLIKIVNEEMLWLSTNVDTNNKILREQKIRLDYVESKLILEKPALKEDRENDPNEIDLCKSMG